MSSTTTKPPGALNRRQIYEQIDGILNTNSVHFITISLLFILFVFFPSVAAINFSDSLTFKTLPTFLNFKTITTILTVSVILSTVAGIALITYSAHQVLHRTPLTFVSTFKSLSHSFIPLLSTFVAGFIKLAFIFILITRSPIVLTEAFKTLGLGFHFDLALISTITNSIGVLTVLYFVVIWGSAASILVLESTFGFTPLTESASQSTEFRMVLYFIVIISGCMIVPCLVFYLAIHNTKLDLEWYLIVQIGVSYLDYSLFVLLYVVSHTLLYVHCKLASGEDTVMEGEEFPKRVMFGGFFKTIWFCIIVRANVRLLKMLRIPAIL